ncbi:MAG: hypothetical protein AB1813_02700 [Verrucomicrobiota bacterium]
MKKFALTSLAALLMATPSWAQPVPLYENFGSVVYRWDDELNHPPVVDATSFANYGSFVITNIIDFNLLGLLQGLGLPYETANTLNFTNRGEMKGLFGFRFNNATVSGRKPAQNFVNGNGGRIEATGIVFDIFDPVTTQFTPANSFTNANINISASNVVNRGVILADNIGLIQISGDKVDLSRGGIGIKPIPGAYSFLQGFCFFGGTSGAGPVPGQVAFFPDAGILDRYWGIDTNVFSLATTIARTAFPPVVTPVHLVTRLVPPYQLFFTQFALFEPQVFVFTNAVTPTNWLIQAVFVENLDPEILTDVRFAISEIPTNVWRTPVIQFSSLEPDVITGGNRTNELYFMDYSTSWTNLTLLTNLASGFSTPTAMPSTFAVSWSQPCEYLPFFSDAPNAIGTPDLFYNTTYSNVVITNTITAYSFFATNLASQLSSGVPITNSSGRIEINANELRMDKARVRGEGYVSIKTKNLISSANSIVDVDHVGLNLGATSGNLNVQGVASEITRRMGGPVFAWSGVWTNFTGLLETNMVEEPPGSGNFTNVVVTNVVEMNFHAMVVLNAMETQFPVKVHEFSTFSTNVVLTDRINVSDSLSVDAQNFTVTGLLNIEAPVRNWTATNFPNLKTLTNSGSIQVNNEAAFGSDRTVPYQVIVNRGTIEAISVNMRSDYFENSGTITAVRQIPDIFTGGVTTLSGPINLDIGIGRLEGGQFTTLRDISIRAKELKLRNHRQSSAALFLSGQDLIADDGQSLSNDIEVRDGFNLFQKPSFGDLFGTRITSIAPAFALVSHQWAGENRGPVVSGFVNNVAIGRLVIESGLDSLHSFTGTIGNNGLYVDYLEFRNVTIDQVDTALEINPGMVVYFADSNLPAEELNDKVGGRLKWVSEFAGVNSGVDVLLLNGQTVRMNRALRNSRTIDSDGDGIPNFFDFYPLDANAGGLNTALAITLPTAQAPVISFAAPAGQTYVIEYTTNLSAPVWKPLENLNNVTVVDGKISISDTNILAGETQRFYRIRFNQ